MLNSGLGCGGWGGGGGGLLVGCLPELQHCCPSSHWTRDRCRYFVASSSQLLQITFIYIFITNRCEHCVKLQVQFQIAMSIYTL